VSELLGTVLMFVGFIRAITPMGGTESSSAGAAV
jgi:hypothetical protein